MKFPIIVNFSRYRFTNSRSLEEIDIQLKSRKRSIDTTSGGSNVTVIEGNLLEEVVDDDSIKTPRQVLSDESKAQIAQALPSCFFRHGSVRASIKKKVRCSDAAEVIPPAEYCRDNDEETSHEDDDDVFSDSAPVQTPRGNMCTPYIERKGSLPGLEALPEWFPNSRLLSSISSCLCRNFLDFRSPTNLFHHDIELFLRKFDFASSQISFFFIHLTGVCIRFSFVGINCSIFMAWFEATKKPNRVGFSPAVQPEILALGGLGNDWLTAKIQPAWLNLV